MGIAAGFRPGRALMATGQSPPQGHWSRGTSATPRTGGPWSHTEEQSPTGGTWWHRHSAGDCSAQALQNPSPFAELQNCTLNIQAKGRKPQLGTVQEQKHLCFLAARGLGLTLTHHPALTASPSPQLPPMGPEHPEAGSEPSDCHPLCARQSRAASCSRPKINLTTSEPIWGMTRLWGGDM